MTISSGDLKGLAVMVFGSTYAEVAASLLSIQLYKANPANLDRLLGLMKEDGFRFVSEAEIDEMATLLRQKMDELEGARA